MIEPVTAAAEASRQENVEKILDCAERLFKHYGYTKTNVADIARDLSMSPANIYRFFSSKADIHQALAKRMLSMQFLMLQENAARDVSASQRMKDHVLLQHRMTVETMMDEEKVHEMVVIAMDQQWPVIEEHLTKVRSLLETVIAEGIASGEFREQDTRIAAEWFMNSGVCLCHPQLISKTLAADEVLTPEQLVDYSLRALK